MEQTKTNEMTAAIITSQELLAHWQGHRNLTRRMIEAFPEKELFEYSIGGMRPFALLVREFLAIAAPGLREIVSGNTVPFQEEIDFEGSKERMLQRWDEATEDINRLWQQIADERFSEHVKLFGQYEGTVMSQVFYFIDNEIHHRGQGYVYLRSLGIEPPFFWER